MATARRQKINLRQAEYTTLQFQVRSVASDFFFLFLLHICHFDTFKCNNLMGIIGNGVECRV